MRQLLAIVVIGSLLVSGCASTGGPRVQSPQALPAAGQAVLAEYVKQLPVGSRVRVDLASGVRMKGTLLKAGDSAIVVQPRTRIPEPAVEIPLADVVAVELEQATSTSRAIWTGVAAGAAGALGVFLILAAIFAGID